MRSKFCLARFFSPFHSRFIDYNRMYRIARDRPDQILAAFLRDADTGSTRESEPLSDPTGCKAIDAACAHQSRPSISRNSSTASSTGSFTSMWTRFPSYKSTDSTERSSYLPVAGTADSISKSEDEGLTRASSNSDSVPVFNQAGNVSSDNIGMKAKDDELYLGLGPLTSQPEVDLFLHPDVSETPTLKTSARMVGSSACLQSTTSAIQDSSSRCAITRLFVTEPPKPIPPPSITNPHRSSSAASSLNSWHNGSSTSCENGSADGKKTNLMPVTKRRNELQARVYRARMQMPGHVVLRVFRDPAECVELEEILG